MKPRQFSPAAFQSAVDLNDDSILRRWRPIQNPADDAGHEKHNPRDTRKDHHQQKSPRYLSVWQHLVINTGNDRKSDCQDQQKARHRQGQIPQRLTTARRRKSPQIRISTETPALRLITMKNTTARMIDQLTMGGDLSLNRK
jgi:hypothetical protein